jgi:hypothetical protein
MDASVKDSSRRPVTRSCEMKTGMTERHDDIVILNQFQALSGGANMLVDLLLSPKIREIAI